MRGRRWQRSVLATTAVRTLLGCLLVLMTYHYVTFDEFETPDAELIHKTQAAVVFTGAYSRIDAGLRLRAGNQVPRLYISGFNRKAGVYPTFVETFAKRNPMIADLGKLMSCCVEVGASARTTFQNALETKCWVNREGISGPLLLVTSRNHMARALADLRGKLPFFEVTPYPINDAPPTSGRERALNFLEYLASLIASRMPISLDPRNPGVFEFSCPPPSMAE